jgi:UDP-N-acetyl-2-amino-2-deoxyglucuronate dehydrogenase
MLYKQVKLFFHGIKTMTIFLTNVIVSAMKQNIFGPGTDPTWWRLIPMKPKNFAIIGVGGYIAPAHLKAIKQTGNNLIAALDISDSVGILDQYSFDIDFFTEFERFDRHAEKLKQLGEDKRLHYISICSPNYLHDSHIRFALRIGANAICEKPLVLNPWNLDALAKIEKETGKRIYGIQQLRLHPAIQKLKHETMNKDQKHIVRLEYITPRGKWYSHSWKGNIEKSGGIVMNIGIHFFDMLIWIFGKVIRSDIKHIMAKSARGYTELQNAHVYWDLSIDPLKNNIPYRRIEVDDKEIDFSQGFNDLHTLSYKYILNGRGFSIEDARPAIEFVCGLKKLSTTVT